MSPADDECTRALFGCVPGDEVRVAMHGHDLYGLVDVCSVDRNGRKLLVQWLDALAVREQWFPLTQCRPIDPQPKARPGFVGGPGKPVDLAKVIADAPPDFNPAAMRYCKRRGTGDLVSCKTCGDGPCEFDRLGVPARITEMMAGTLTMHQVHKDEI